MARGGRGGRFRFSGSRDTALADVLDETREDLGLSHAQMEQLQTDTVGSLFPPIELPQPERLSDKDAILIQRQRLLAHKIEQMYQPSNSLDELISSPIDIMSIQMTIPDTIQDGMLFVPKELVSQSIQIKDQRQRNINKDTNRIIQPRTFENVFKALETQEQNVKEKGLIEMNAIGENELIEEQEEDLGDDMNDYTYAYSGSDIDSEDGDEEVFF